MREETSPFAVLVLDNNQHRIGVDGTTSFCHYCSGAGNLYCGRAIAHCHNELCLLRRNGIYLNTQLSIEWMFYKIASVPFLV